jgi:hypothetical protein
MGVGGLGIGEGIKDKRWKKYYQMIAVVRVTWRCRKEVF